VERWLKEDYCEVSWSDGNLIVNSDGEGNAAFRCVDFNFFDVDYLAVRVKNESPATYLTVVLTIQEPYEQDYQIRVFNIPVRSSDTEYQTYIADLPTQIEGWGRDWRIKNLKLTAVNQTEGSTLSIDYIKFLTTLPPCESLDIVGVTTIDGLGVEEKMSVNIVPELANKTVIWSVDSPDIATIDDSTGVLTTVAAGEVVVSATATDGSGVSDSKTITVSYTAVSEIEIDPPESSEVNLINDFKLLTYTITPVNASNKMATWSVVNGTGSATIDEAGKLVPVSEGEVTVAVTSNDNSSLAASVEITITNINIPVTAIEITSTSGFELNFDESLQLDYTIKPYNATNPDVTWELLPGTSTAMIDTTGLLTAESEGTVTVRATADDGSGISSGQQLTITRIITGTDSITIEGPDAVYGLGLTAPLSVGWCPENSTWKSLSWSVDDETKATIDEKTGELTSVAEGTVTVTSTVDSTDNVSASKEVRIQNRQVKAKEWNFTNSTESWNWGILNCKVSQSNGNLVIDAHSNDKDDNANFGNGSMLFSCADVNYFVVSVKNESPAKSMAMWIWASTPETSERIYLLNIPIQPYQSEYKTYIMYMPDEVNKFSHEWSINRLRIDPATAGKTGTLSIDYMRFISNISQISSINVTGTETLAVGATLQMGAEVVPIEATDAIRYSVSDETIATIDPYTGILTGVSVGEVTVIASVPGTLGVKGEKVVSINNQVVKAESITITGYDIIDGLGLTRPYTAMFTPGNTTDKTVKYSISDESIATIDENTGMLTTVSVGEVIVKATVQDGSGVTGEKAVRIIHTVYASSIVIEGPSTIDGIGQQVQLSVVFDPAETTNQTVKYRIDRPNIATIDENTGLLTTVSAGGVRIFAYAQDGSGVVGRKYVTVSNLTSVHSLDDTGLIIYPNPIERGENLQLDFLDTPLSGNAMISVVDLQGKVVYKEELRSQQSIAISTSDFNRGIYVISVISGTRREHLKLVIQ
jgi:uncharacterized protein YjdB